MPGYSGHPLINNFLSDVFQSLSIANLLYRNLKAFAFDKDEITDLSVFSGYRLIVLNFGVEQHN